MYTSGDGAPPSRVLGEAGVSIPNRVGDLEYFFTATISAPYYNVQDYACGVKYGAGWSEAITAITNRANYVDETPAGGHDYFVRIRESESPYEWVKLCTSLTTNGTTGVVKEDFRMELVGTNTWRYCFYVPTNSIGETLKFHFEGKKLEVDPENAFKFVASTNVWKCDLSTVPYLPYTSVAGEGFANDVAVKLDNASTHLIIEINDALQSYSVSHGTFQNFNAWTDAMEGYRGNAKYDEENPTNGASATGVSDTKKKFVANMADWEMQGYTDPFWFEDFDTDDQDAFPRFKPFDSAVTPLNGWEVGHAQWIPGVRGSAAIAASVESAAVQLEGRGQGYVALDKTSGMPRGIGTVTFGARVAQAPRFDDFAVYGDGSSLEDYAVSAKISMSRQATSNWNPTDISPAQPSVSLIGHYREKKGCYEYRITRIASDQLCCALYKWKPVSGSGMTAHLLASNVVTSVNNSAYAKPGPGQTSFSNFQNMLVPGSGENAKASWTAAYLFLFNKGDGSVYLECMLSNSRNNKSILAESNDAKGNFKKVLVFTDSSDAPFLKGSYGVGSTDCNASFGDIRYHLPADGGNYSAGIDYSGTSVAPEISGDDWAFYLDRWQQPKSTETEFGTGSLNAVMPSSQTIRLQFKDDEHGWFDSGYEAIVSSFSTNRYEFAPCVSPDYGVRLITGGNTYDEVRTDVVVDDVEITAWRAADYPNLNATGKNGQSAQWVYMAGTLESSAEIEGPGTVAVGAAGTNGYAFSFSAAGVYSVVPKMDLEIDRILLVGGGGAGGNVMGGGGGGGQVYEIDLGTNGIVAAEGTKFSVTVGGGGAADSGSNQNAGKDGGQTSITINGKTYTAKGGGGGGGWSSSAGRSGASGGGASNQASGGAATAGNKGGNGANGRGGGGGGAGEAGGDYTLGYTTVAKTTEATRNLQNAYWADGGKGGDGVANDITGEWVYYGGGGGGGAGWSAGASYNYGGDGGKGGGGRGADAYGSGTKDKVTVGNGVDGLGGGGGGGGGWNDNNAHKAARGGKGGNGVVILHMKSASKVCTLQPSRGDVEFSQGLRSPYLENGLSMFSFNYANANSNSVLWLQVCTNDVIEGESSMSAQLTKADPLDGRWNTIRTFAFTNATPKELASGACSHFMSLRSPYRGFLRLVVAPEVMQYCAEHEGPDRDVDYGKITITSIHCYDEPPLDQRSWWGWNLHTEGWNTDDKQYAYLFDSPDGLSASLNFSSKNIDNTKPDARGIGLMQPELELEYAANNSFVQCPPLTNGIGTVTFRARTFTTNQAHSSYITLFGSSEPDSYQVEVPDDWTELATFKITNTTYQTFKWSTTDDTTKFYAVRLEVNGSRHGRSPGSPASWEKPKEVPIERVWVDEITASEPIAPRIVFRDVRPFRSGLSDTVNPKPVTNVTDLSEQPILGESWGLQATVEPQQMSDELKEETVKVYCAFYNGISPWGFNNWSNKVSFIELEKVGSNLVFRSTYNNAASIIGPDMATSGVFPKSVWQYYVWAEYEDKQGVRHVHGLESSEWQPPSWYYGIKNLNETYGSNLPDRFSGYTILDSISPQRAWLNEVNISDVGDYADYDNQFIEIAVPQNADLSDWRIDVVDLNVYRGTIAVFGSGNANITSKTGTRPGVDNTNHYTFVSLRSPDTAKAGNCPGADGIWNKTPIDTQNPDYKGESASLAVYDGQLRYYQPYGLALIRPSGIIEHQVVVQGTNIYEGLVREWAYSGTNLLAKIRAKDGENSHWFFAGKDMWPGTLGVFRSHGEDASCWTNKMIATPSELNKMADGTLQSIDPDWFLQPNGTNVWIYANVLGAHTHQKVGANTNNSAVVIIRKGDSTNIVYTTDSWYQIGEVTTNGVTVAGARGRGSRTDTPAHTWTLHLKDVNETITVNVDDERSKDVADAKLDVSDPYYPAIMSWLTELGDDLSGLHFAEQWDLSNTKVADLDIKDMYWLNIDPTQEGWVLKAGMGGVGASMSSAAAPGGASLAAVAPVPYEDKVLGSLTNVRVLVTMMITNQVTGDVRKPDRIQGLEPGSSSYAYDGSSNWTSATFKICGALQKEGVQDKFYPLRWFVFGPASFDENFQSKIEISDPHSKSSPGYFNGWHDYPDIPVFYKWKLNADPANYDTTEMLKANSLYQ
ncbi:MAG: glycine-rich domain-containing protein [Kiritimatiellia bacterium]